MKRDSFAAFFFDLDGTLVDTEILWLRAIEDAMAGRGEPLTREASQELVYGKSWADIFARIQREWPGLWSDIREMEAVTEPRFHELKAETDMVIHSSVDLLRQLHRETDATVAIVSGSTRDTIARTVEDLAIGECVDFILGCDEYHPGKPDPTPYLRAAEIASVDAAACLVFEDSTVGVAAARSAGMACVALARPEAPAQDVSAADLVVPDLAEIPWT